MRETLRIPPELADRVVQWRRQLHAHPELSFAEYDTAAFVARQLSDMGVKRIYHPTPTSVVAEIGAGDGPVIGLRADMDALPVEEESGVDFRSTRHGVSHACGHDAHTAMLLGVAMELVRSTPRNGRIRLIFQHGEEVQPGGAAELVAAGVVEGLSALVGLHIWSQLEVGTVAVHHGRAMASNDAFTITVTGAAGHAGMPHGAIDPISIAAQVVTGIQQAVTRQVDVLDPGVISIGQFVAGQSYNVLPEKAVLRGTMRAFSAQTRERLAQIVERVSAGVAQMHGGSAAVEHVRGSGPVINAGVVSHAVAAIAEDIPGIAVRTDWPPLMAGEDFSAYQAHVPSAFVFLGGGGPDYPAHHHPRFRLDEAALPLGVQLLHRTALGLLEQTLGQNNSEPARHER